jgi:hypothetical protein
MIKIIFEQAVGRVRLDQTIHDIVNHSVEIDLSGWHLLSISAFDTDHLQIKDIMIEGISIGHMMLIMFLAETKQCTFGWVDRREFCMPLHPNYAMFRSVVFFYIDQGDYGSQIYEQYDFSLNKNPLLQHQYPKHVVDYFLQETSPTWHKKYNKRSPWFLGPQIDCKKITQEIDQVKHKFSKRTIKLDSYLGWNDTFIKVNSIDEVRDAGLEYFSEILLQCKFTKLENINIGYLPPGGFINSHKDLMSGEKGRNKVYIPVDFSPGNYFKFSPGGYVELNTSYATCMNTDCFLHAVVNDSNSGRLIIGGTGYADWD